MKKMLSILILIILLTLSLTACVKSSNYHNSEKQKDTLKNDLNEIEYAYQWAFGVNENYYKFTTTDCANYVSQCLFASGLPMKNEWHSFKNEKKFDLRGLFSYKYKFDWDVTPTWRLVSDQFNYFRNSKYILSEVTISADDNINQIIKYNYFKVGDLMYLDNNGDQNYNHATIISKITNEKIYYTAHTSDQFNKDLQIYFDDYPQAKVTILILK